MTVWPALFPPWLRTTISASAVSTSMIFPFPSSPHCAPIRIVLAMTIWAKFCPDALGRGIRDLHHRIRAATCGARPFWTRGAIMRYPKRNMRTILLIILVLLLIGALPTWPYSSGWGYFPGGGLLLL